MGSPAIFFFMTPMAEGISEDRQEKSTSGEVETDEAAFPRKRRKTRVSRLYITAVLIDADDHVEIQRACDR